eukprot:scaffold59400_cov20-Tisochrysis_lutea.AAC.3
MSMNSAFRPGAAQLLLLTSLSLTLSLSLSLTLPPPSLSLSLSLTPFLLEPVTVAFLNAAILLALATVIYLDVGACYLRCTWTAANFFPTYRCLQLRLLDCASLTVHVTAFLYRASFIVHVTVPPSLQLLHCTSFTVHLVRAWKV